MKKLYLLNRLVIFSFVAIWLFGCASKDEKDIQGKWKRIDIADINSTWVEAWTFGGDGGQLIIHIDANPGLYGQTSPINDTCRYYLNARLRKTFVHVENCGVSYYNGDWQIIHLNTSTMMIVRNSPMTPEAIQASGNSGANAGLLFREFTKE